MSRASKWAAINGGALNQLGLSGPDLAIGVQVILTIVGATAGSAITASGLPAGWVLNSAARTITGTPIAGLKASFTLTETLAGKANSPKVNALALALPKKLAVYDPDAADVARFATPADRWASSRGKPRIVGTHGRGKTNLLATSATHNTFESRYCFYVGADTPYVQIAIDNWSIASTGADMIPPTALAIEGIALVNLGLTVAVPGRFFGAAAVSAPAGATIFSDPIHATSFGLPYFKRGTFYWVDIRANVPVNTGQIPSGGTQYNIPGTYSSRFDPTAGTNNVSQVGKLGAFTSKTGQDSFAAPMSFTAIIGQPLDPRIPSLLGEGTSIDYSSADDNTLVTGAGWIMRAAFNAAQQLPVPIVNLSVGSSSLAGSMATLSRRSVYYQFATTFIDGHGTGDIGPTGNGDMSAFEANEVAFWALHRSAGISKIIKPKVLPRNASSDAWATLAGQTQTANFDTKGAQANAFFDAQLAAGLVDVVQEQNAARADLAANYWKWAVTGAANYPTADGTHPSAAIHALLAADLRATLERLYPQIAVA